MSTILEALRRLEKDKRTESAAPLESRILEPQRPSRSAVRPILPWAVSIGAILLAGGLFFLSNRQPVERLAARTPLEVAPQAQAPVPAPLSPVQRERERTPRSQAPSMPGLLASPSRERQSSALQESQQGPKSPADRSRDDLAKAPAPSAASAPKVAPARRNEVTQTPRRAASDSVSEKPTPPPSAVAEAAPSIAPASPPRATPSESPPPTKAVQVVARAPDFVVLKTIWHPSAERRSARLEFENGGTAREVREGQWVEGFEVREIRLSGVVLEKEGVRREYRVGRRP